MKVIKDNRKRFPITTACVSCESFIEIESIEELEWKGDDIYLWACPCCGFENRIIAPLQNYLPK